MKHIIPISGKDSLATAIWQTAHDPGLPYEFVYNDTGSELPETYRWLELVEKTLGISILRIGANLEDIIEGYGILPSSRIRFCTKDAKIRPMNRFIGKDKAIVYFGLRADEPERIGAFESKKLLPRYPLREAGIGLATVYRIVQSRGLMPPAFFWHRLWNEVIRQVGEPIWEEWIIARVFAWRSRPNCYFCFFQRLYEWVGLLEYHPELFEKAERIEAVTGNGEGIVRDHGFYWIRNEYPLAKIRQNAKEIFQKRVDAVCKLVARSHQQELLFADASVDEMDVSGVSCGLLCGK